MSAIPLWYIFVVAAAGFVLGTYWLACRRRAYLLRLPPSPPADPFIGHYRIFPRTYQAAVFFEWSQRYGQYACLFLACFGFGAFANLVRSLGDVFYLEILGRKIVIVNNYDVANELLHKRSAIYSDRPVFPLFMK